MATLTQAELQAIGINLDIRPGGPDLDNEGVMQAAVAEVDDSGLWNGNRPQFRDPTTHPDNPSIIINGQSFWSLREAGPGGSYGVPLVVRTYGDAREYILKRQAYEAGFNTHAQNVKEPFIGRALYKMTNTNAGVFTTGPASLNVYYIVRGDRNHPSDSGPTRYYYMLMEKAENGNFGDYVNAHPTRLRPCFKRLAEWLQSLQASCGFIHADFKGNNVMMDALDHMRIIDYGWNQMTINNVVVRCKLDETQYRTWRDVTLMAHYIYLFSPLARSATNHAFLQYVTEQCVRPNPPVTRNPPPYGGPLWALTSTGDGRNYRYGYTWMNEAPTNPRARPAQVVAYLAADASDPRDAAPAAPNPFTLPPGPAGPPPGRRSDFCAQVLGYGAAAGGGYWALGGIIGGPMGAFAGALAGIAVGAMIGQNLPAMDLNPNMSGGRRKTRKIKRHSKRKVARRSHRQK